MIAWRRNLRESYLKKIIRTSYRLNLQLLTRNRRSSETNSAARKNPDAYTGNLPGNSGRQVAHLTKESNRPLKLLKDIKGCLKEQQRKPVLPATDCTHFRQWRHSQDCVNLPHAINLLTNAGKTRVLKCFHAPMEWEALSIALVHQLSVSQIVCTYAPKFML